MNKQLNDLLKYYQTKQYDNAEKLAVSITKEFPKHPFTWKVLAAALKQNGRIDESLVASQKSVQLDPQDAEAHYNLGIVMQELGRLDEAEAIYKKAITLKPDHKTYNNLGIVMQELGRLDEAEASYKKAITLKPDFIQAINNRWLLLFNQKRFEEALLDADLCISKGSRQLDLTTLYALGRIDEIYKRLEVRSKIDGENITIAAFASFIAECQQEDTAHRFCKKPLEFIYSSNISAKMKESNSFITGEASPR